MAAAAASAEAPRETWVRREDFDTFFKPHGDGKFAAPPGNNLFHSLYILIHPVMYGVNPSISIRSTLPEVAAVISPLAEAILNGEEPLAPEQIHTRLRGLTVSQKEHFVDVLMEGTDRVEPPLLKNIHRISPLHALTFVLPPYADVRRSGEDIDACKWRIVVLMEWEAMTLTHCTYDDLSFVRGKIKSQLEDCGTLVRGLLNLIVGPELTRKKRRLIKELNSGEVYHPGMPVISLFQFVSVFMPALIMSDIPLITPERGE